MRGTRVGVKGCVESFPKQFSLSTPEGQALMALGERLLRTPDDATKNRLIAEKVSAADWAAHLGQSDSLLVNAATWGLMLTGRLIDVSGMNDVVDTIRKLAARAVAYIVAPPCGKSEELRFLFSLKRSRPILGPAPVLTRNRDSVLFGNYTIERKSGVGFAAGLF